MEQIANIDELSPGAKCEQALTRVAGELVVVHCAIHPFTRHVTFAVLQELGGQYVDSNGHAEDALIEPLISPVEKEGTSVIVARRVRGIGGVPEGADRSAQGVQLRSLVLSLATRPSSTTLDDKGNAHDRGGC